MAKKLNISESQVSQLIGKTPTKSIGSRLARRIEREYKLPPGWLDVANHDLTEDAATFARRYQALEKGQQKALRDLLASFKK